jgi:cytoskeletal protein CcmA (bactofilin family)
MFSKSKSNAAKSSRAPKIATVIGKGTVITGDVRFVGGLHVDGKVIGNTHADDDINTTLTLSELGLVEGDIHVPNVILNGEVEGNVYASARVELAPKANIHGNVYYRFLEMQMGAVVNGQLIRTEDDVRLISQAESAKGAEEGKPAAPAKAPAAASAKPQVNAAKPGAINPPPQGSGKANP